MADPSPIRPTDDEARAMARGLIDGARFGALGVVDPDTTMPMVTRVAIGTDPDGAVITLISALSHHTRALRADPRASILVGEPGAKGDPLTYPRLTISGRMDFIEHDEPAYAPLANHYLATHPKSKLYIGFADFAFARLVPDRAYLNGGFGKAFVLGPKDLRATA